MRSFERLTLNVRSKDPIIPALIQNLSVAFSCPSGCLTLNVINQDYKLIPIYYITFQNGPSTLRAPTQNKGRGGRP
jgi:hypothetical protein